MTAPDLVIRAGFEDAEYQKSLKRWGGYSEREAWKIAKDFERAERAKERAAREQSAKIRQSYERMQRVHQVATVAMAAGLGVFTKAVQRAAERNRDLRAEIEAIGRAGDEFLSDLGDDLSPFIGSIAELIDKLGTARRAASDFFAMFALGVGGQGKLYEINYQLDQAEKGRKAFESELTAQDIEADLNGDQDDPDRKYRRDFNRRIGDVGDPARRAELRAQLDRQLKQRDAERRRTAAHATDQRRLDTEARRLSTRARRNPGDYDAERAAINARSAAERNRAAEAIRGDDTIADEDKYRAIQQAMTLISAEQAEQLELARQQREQQERDLAQRRRRHALDEAAQRVQLERAKGNEREAEAMGLALQYEERRLRLMEDQTLTAEQRARMIANEQAIFDAQVSRLGAGTGRGRGRANVVQAGFAGDAVTAGQALGVRSEQRQLVDLQKKANDYLREISEHTRESQTARVG